MQETIVAELHPTTEDIKTLSKLSGVGIPFKKDNEDYSSAIVKKPWGYEYLIFENKQSAVWVLFIKSGHQTSMHCHPNKKTSLIVLKGRVKCSTLSKDFNLGVRQSLLIEKKVFHQTKAISEEGSFVIEIETPVSKKDLIRLKDKYGREGKGYESKENFSYNKQNYNHVSLNSLTTKNVEKRKLGDCSLTIHRINDFEKQSSQISDTSFLLCGKIYSNNKILFESGDHIKPAVLQQYKKFSSSPYCEVLSIKKLDSLTKVSDFIIQFLQENQINPVFTVPGESNLHLLDSIGRLDGMNFICLQNEKSVSLAVEAFAKSKNKIGAMIISSGASPVNAIPGVANSWIDSTPVLVISGQARSDQSNFSEVRQLGNKEFNTIKLVKDITKYAVKVTDPNTILYHLTKALHIAMSGKPGPVWLDIPIDIQGMTIDEKDQKKYKTRSIPSSLNSVSKKELLKKLSLLKTRLGKSKRPVILLGNGIRNYFFSRMKLEEGLKKLGIPVLLSRRGADLLDDDFELNFGRPGAYGQRSANFIIQNSDLLITVGSRLSIPLIGRNTNSFARSAYKVVIDIDDGELNKPTVGIDLKVLMSAESFLSFLFSLKIRFGHSVRTNWIKQCKHWRQEFPPDYYLRKTNDPQNQHENLIFPLSLFRKLNSKLSANTTIVVDGGPPLIYALLSLRFRGNQRIISSPGLDLKGFALAASIGTKVSSKNSVLCICEDSGFMSSAQDLQTIIDYGLDVKILVVKTGSFSIIRNIQIEYFGGRTVGTDQLLSTTSSLSKIAKAYGFSTFGVKSIKNLDKTLNDFILVDQPAICVVDVIDDHKFLPKPGFKIKDDQTWIANPLEDMYPFLERSELKDNMLIDLYKED